MLKDAPIRAYIPASNVSRARKFYEEKVGLRPREEYSGGVFYECGGAEVFLYPTPNAGTSIAGLSGAPFAIVTLGSGTAVTMTGNNNASLSIPTLETSNLMKLDWLKAS